MALGEEPAAQAGGPEFRSPEPAGLLRRGVGCSQESAEVYAAVNPRPYLKHRLTTEAVLWAPQVGVAHVCHTQN